MYERGYGYRDKYDDGFHDSYDRWESERRWKIQRKHDEEEVEKPKPKKRKKAAPKKKNHVSDRRLLLMM